MSAPSIGAHVGWVLDFRDGPADGATKIASFGSADYVGSIDASLPSGLAPGSYAFVIEGVSSERYRDLFTQMRAGQLVVNLYLFWRDDGNVTGYLVDLAGLADTLAGDLPPPNAKVATLRVMSIARRPGPRRYEVVIEAREWVFDRLTRRLSKLGTGDLVKAPELIGQDVGIAVSVDEALPPPAVDDGTRTRAWSQGEVALDRMRELGSALEAASGRHGLGMFQIVDHITLHVGPERLAIANLHEDELTDATGLVEIRARGMVSTDPYWVPDADHAVEPLRASYQLVLRGRPDIFPGDFVEFTRPPEEADAAGTPDQFSLDLRDETPVGDTIRLYVQGVTHSLSRDRPFITLLNGVAVPREERPYAGAWFAWSSARTATPAKTHVDDGTPDGRFVSELHATLKRAGGKQLDTAQVRASNVVAGGALTVQTEKLWRGLVADDGRRYAATVLPFDRDAKASFDDAPYATSFAWGRFGLVLPRYPGMRVIVGHRNGDSDDVLDLGATWTRGEAPPSEVGDYWLALPTEIGDRGPTADDRQPAPPTGKASNDLIDARGARVIEVGKLTVRVGADLLHDGGTRPIAADDHVHIEHQSGARISIDQSGNITIKAAGTLDFIAGGAITFDTPANVTVKTDGFMDVKRQELMATDAERDLQRKKLLGWGFALEPIDGGDGIARDLVMANGQLATVEGIANLGQDLTVALTTPLTGDVFNVDFGFDGLNALTQESSAILVQERVRVSVVTLLQKDPRVRRIIDVQLEDGRLTNPGAGTRELDVRVVFETVTGDSQTIDLGKVLTNG